jgi:hypothetical protein
MLGDNPTRRSLRLAGLIFIACVFVGALVKLWMHRSETYLDFARGAGPQASQITEFGQFSFMRRAQVFYGEPSPQRVETHTAVMPLGLAASALATLVVAGLVLALIGPGVFGALMRRLRHRVDFQAAESERSRAELTVSGEWRRLAIIGLLAVLAGTTTGVLCGFFYPGLILTPPYLAGVAFRIFFADLVPTLLMIVLVHLVIRRLRIPRSVLFVLFFALGLVVCKLTTIQWWSVAIAVTISTVAWLLYIVGPSRIWQIRAE